MVFTLEGSMAHIAGVEMPDRSNLNVKVSNCNTPPFSDEYSCCLPSSKNVPPSVLFNRLDQHFLLYVS